MTDDNQVILDRAADSCRALDDIRYKLYTIQKQLAQARTQSGGAQQDTLSKTCKEKAMTALLHEAYTLQFQIATLLTSTEEPIPERQRRRPKSAQTPTTTTTGAMTTTTTTADGGLTAAESIPSIVATEQQQSFVTGQEIFDTTMASQVETDVVVLDNDM
ncbi:hypothetical protein BG006_009838 [Podila minutissima]|uniref:Uncharacterized protein n=1 Tax=Podila minutissima TaxID=64525 RepID=A0A9P5SI08_9FUNG|nr:hypothetical protein BG006_009838 [Podila minutissima]